MSEETKNEQEIIDQAVPTEKEILEDATQAETVEQPFS